MSHREYRLKKFDELNGLISYFPSTKRFEAVIYSHGKRLVARGGTEEEAKLAVVSKYEMRAFEKVAKPVIEYLNDNHHPHTTVIVTPTSAEVLEGVMSTGQILDYVKD